ncbi:hypothetical protein EDB80DRAFT_559228 [Ilyonectria destructans]|nr:hypothetical protein EDB80DRAFT_559228 [Ilyonectria destructans]
MLRPGSEVVGFRGLRAAKRPLRKLAFGVLSGWLVTVVLSVSIFVALYLYSNKPVMSKKERREFNAIITGLAIALGLAIASNLNGMVGDLRWWILSRRYRSRRKVELIMEADSMLHVITLAARSRRLSIHIAALLWLFLIIGAQVGVASLGLCYSNNTAQKHALMVPGMVSIPDMSSLQTARLVSDKSSSLSAQQYTANSYGTVSIGYDMGTMDQVPGAGIIWFPGDSLVFCADTTCRYVFHETSTESILNSAANPTTVTTSRSIDASAMCNSWPVKSGGDGTETNITVITDEGQETVFIPVAGGIDQTTFVTNTSESCGVGCSSVYAFEASNTSPWYYECNITVSKVANATRSEHNVSADLTTIMSGAIALQGYEASSLVNVTDIQYQAFPAESIFGTPVNGSEESLSFLLARFTIGVVAATADNNNDLSIDGMAPEVGSELDVTHWNLVTVILILLAGLQLILGVTSALVANRVVVPDGGAVAVTQVLRAMASQDTIALRGGSTSESLQGPGRKSLWIYRDTKVSEGVYDLHMEGDSFSVRENSDPVDIPSNTAIGDESVLKRAVGHENTEQSERK